MNIELNIELIVILVATDPKHFKSKSNLHYTRGITPKRVTNNGVHLQGLAPGQHISEKIS